MHPVGRAQAVPRLEALVGRVLLGAPGRGLLWGHRLLHRLLQLFMDFDFTVAAVLRGLQARARPAPAAARTKAPRQRRPVGPQGVLGCP
jgi:hypothetical protein